MGTLPTVAADPTQLVQVFQNLIGNAIKYRGERPPEVRIDVEHRAGGWQFSVCDNGIGIDPQYFDRIFGIFQRLHTRKEYPGTGIGLALCKKIIERHGSRIVGGVATRKRLDVFLHHSRPEVKVSCRREPLIS